MEIYIILVWSHFYNVIIYIWCNVCIWRNKKDALWLVILSIQIYFFLSFPLSFFKENYTAGLGGRPGFGVWFFLNINAQTKN